MNLRAPSIESGEVMLRIYFRNAQQLGVIFCKIIDFLYHKLMNFCSKSIKQSSIVFSFFFKVHPTLETDLM